MTFPGKERWFSWSRLLRIGVTAWTYGIVFQSMDVARVGASLERACAGWFGLGILAFGLALGLGALRWHLALRATNCRVHLGACARLLVIGHFCRVATLGSAASDPARAKLYARWFGLPIGGVLAACGLDHGLGAVAMGVILACSFVPSAWTGSFPAIHPIGFHVALP
jgi:uncharacterized membrane protein YbhN (UPF0104 family)